ncbi:hypothetical protein HPB52_017284 [Rhipicephalus sanguineus]|uniref:Ion transport domain-containing protein n=1 Tax=Rhipicephalus sanguineus TaxID=34632 RepID=A0A9D4T0W5_RHISA|nr:hypothetical protein HPB52_017284 [Rhipicephalus sanguineus]
MEEELQATSKFNSKLSRASVMRRRASMATGPTLSDMAPLLSQTLEMSRPPVKEFLKHGLDAPVPVKGHGRQGAMTASSNITYGSVRATGAELKRQLELFLLPDNPLLSSALLRQPSIDQQHQQFSWMIHPSGKFRARWDMTMVLLVLSNVVLIPVQATYFGGVDEEVFQWMLFSLVSDAVFAVDIVFNFRTGVIVEEDYERVVMDPGYVARCYLRGFFLIDLVSTLPWDYVLAFMLMVFHHEVDEGDTSFAITVRLLHLTKFLKLLKLLRITRLVRYLDNVEQNYFFYSNGVYLRLTNYIGLLLLIGHWNACLQFFVARMQGFPPDSWVAKQDLVASGPI